MKALATDAACAVAFLMFLAFAWWMVGGMRAVV